ncbi:MAG: DUF4432 family protein, partial [Clostridia bacterium]|nr:DUF4432 family protein [Clostridia bacterium]
MDGRISNLQQVANLRRYTLTEGREKGLDVIDCDNGKIRFLLNVSKALDVMQVYHQGQNVSFLSKNAFTGRESHFLNRFEGGMIYTCGLDSAGGRDGYELHGTLHNIPAEVVCAKCTETEIVVEALVRDTALFGKNLMLRRRIASVIGSNTFTLEDTLVNNGYKAEDYCLLYHVNVGYPMLDDGVKINLSEVSCEPRTAWAKENEGSRYEITAPTPGMEETCYFLKLKTGKVEVINEKLGKTLTLEYSLDTLPCFVEWKSMAS